MGIKLGSVVTAIIFLFIAKISLEASMDVKGGPQLTTTSNSPIDRSPASVKSIDDGYAAHVNGLEKSAH